MADLLIRGTMFEFRDTAADERARASVIAIDLRTARQRVKALMMLTDDQVEAMWVSAFDICRSLQTEDDA